MLTFTPHAKAEYWKMVPQVDLQRFMGDWYVIGGRMTCFEDGAHNAVENYTWNEEKQRIDVTFTFNKDSFDGKLKTMTQKGYVQEHPSNAHWEISPLWPLRFDYLVIGLAEDYSWTAIGVPDQDYLWIMAREPYMSEEQLESILQELSQKGYDTEEIVLVPQQWEEKMAQ